MAKADKVAFELSQSVECDGVFISLLNRNRLYSFGMTGAEGEEDASRHHELSDTICGVTIARNAPFEVSDTRKDDDLSDIPYAVQGAIVGYLGEPIRDAEANPIGAICAVSSKPCTWNEADRMKLQMSRMEVEYLLATELLKKEMNFLSDALGDYDKIVMTLTNNIKLMASVHDEDGTLLFATNALLEEIDAPCLEKAVRHQQRSARAIGGNQLGEGLGDSADNPHSPHLHVASKSDRDKSWYGTRQCGPGAISFVNWKVSSDNLV